MTNTDDLIEKIKAYPNAQQQRNDILKLSWAICTELNQFREKIILESSEITEEKESLISKSDAFKKEITQNNIIQYLIKYFSIEEIVEKEVLKQYKTELSKITNLLIKQDDISRNNYFRLIEEEIRLVKEQQKLNEKIIQELYFPKDKVQQESVYKLIYSAPALIPFTSPQEAKSTVDQLSLQIISRNDLISQAQKSNDWGILKADKTIQQKNHILAGLSDPKNSGYFNTDKGRKIKRALETGVTIIDFEQRLGAWDRADEAKRDSRERMRLLTSVQNLYETFKLDLLSEYQALKKSDKPEDKAKAEEIKQKFGEMENLADILIFPQGEKYRDCLAKIYDLDKPDDKGQYQLKSDYESIENNPNLKHLSLFEMEEKSFLDESDLKINALKETEQFNLFDFFNPDSLVNKKSAPGLLHQFQRNEDEKNKTEDSEIIKPFIPGYDQNSNALIRKNNHYIRLCEQKLLPILTTPLDQDNMVLRENKVFHVLYKAYMKEKKQGPINQHEDVYLQALAKELAADKEGIKRVQKVTQDQGQLLINDKQMPQQLISKNKNITDP